MAGAIADSQAPDDRRASDDYGLAEELVAADTAANKLTRFPPPPDRSLAPSYGELRWALLVLVLLLVLVIVFSGFRGLRARTDEHEQEHEQDGRQSGLAP